MQSACLPVDRPPTGCAYNSVNGDIIDQAVPWNTTNWQLVHSGHLPLWNADSGTGEPQLLNFESAVFALPTLVGYLAPESWAFLTTVLMKLLIAGLGLYWCARVLGARPAAAVLGGVSFLSSGALVGWLGWSVSGVLVFAGPILATAVLAYRSTRALWPLGLLSVAVAFAIFGGFPEAYVLLAIALGVLLVVAGAASLAFGVGVAWQGIVRIGIGAAGGAGLSAVLWLPGISVLRSSVRGGEIAATGLPLHYAALLLAPGYDGVPTPGNVFFGNLVDQGLYFETAASVTTVTVVLALVGIISGRRRPVVLGLGAAAVACCLLSYRLGPVSPVQRLIIDLGGSALVLSRALALVGFALCVLGALGAETVLGGHAEPRVRMTLGISVGIVGAAVAVLVGVAIDSSLPPVLRHLRRESLWWPVATTAFMAVVAVALVVLHRAEVDRGRAAFVLRALPVALVGVGSAAGLFTEVGINSYAHTAYPETQATEQLAAQVGSSLVGIEGGNAGNIRQWVGVGYYPNINTAYGIDELGLHDPTISAAYFASWPVHGVDPGGALNLFVPDVDTVALARAYGVGYVLGAPSIPAPAGAVPVGTIAGGVLSRVPDSGRFTMDQGASQPLRFTHPDDVTYTVAVSGRSGPMLAKITDSPGWTASADGRALRVTAAAGATSAPIFLTVDVPRGTAEVTFTYRPPHFGVAIGLGVATVAAYVAAGEWSRRRRAARST